MSPVRRSLTVLTAAALSLSAAFTLAPSHSHATPAAAPSAGYTGTTTSAIGNDGHEVVASATYRLTRVRVCTRHLLRTRCRYVVRRTLVRPTARRVTPVRVLGGPYKWLGTDGLGHPAHFNRCSVVRYRINPAGAPATFSADVTRALQVVHAATGLTFRYMGASKVVPYSTANWTSTTPRDADLYIAWSDAAHVARLAGAVAGVGGNAFAWQSGQLPRITVAGLSLDRASGVKPGFGPGFSTGALLLHELGHAVGDLDHVSDSTQIMYPTLSSTTRAAYQRGDLAGLTIIKNLPCFAS